MGKEYVKEGEDLQRKACKLQVGVDRLSCFAHYERFSRKNPTAAVKYLNEACELKDVNSCALSERIYRKTLKNKKMAKLYLEKTCAVSPKHLTCALINTK